MNPLGVWSKNHVCWEPNAVVVNVTCLDMKKAYNFCVCMEVLRKLSVAQLGLKPDRRIIKQEESNSKEQISWSNED